MEDYEIHRELIRIVPEQVRSRLSDDQKRDVIKIFKEKPGTIAAICQRTLSANSAYGYFSAALAGEIDELSRQPQPTAARHDLEVVACRDCGDTGFVTLTRDVGPDALAGDAAACHCSMGQHKLHKQDPTKGSTGTRVNLPNLPLINYTRDDFEPAVPDPDAPDLWFHDYARTEAGKDDPFVAKILSRGGPRMRSLGEEIDWKDEP